jgi:hypothetical protein
LQYFFVYKTIYEHMSLKEIKQLVGTVQYIPTCTRKKWNVPANPHSSPEPERVYGLQGDWRFCTETPFSHPQHIAEGLPDSYSQENIVMEWYLIGSGVTVPVSGVEEKMESTKL